MLYADVSEHCLFHLHRRVGLNILNPSHSSYLPAYEDGTERVFRNVGIKNSEAGELPRRKHTIYLQLYKFALLGPVASRLLHSFNFHLPTQFDF
jgi:hypothetical protein